jgi:methyl-accepting chemotaxis protein/methyl-accepting chemotaxis protein-1 (serine sensor receptor)
MQWTIGKKLYSGLGLLALVVVAMAAGGMYSQSKLSDSVDQVTLKIGPNIRYVGQLRFLSEAFRSANRYNVILAAQRNAEALETNRKKMEDLHAEFTKTAKELEQNAPIEELKDLARQSVTAMDAFAAKGMEIQHLAAAFKAAEAAEEISKAAPLGNKVQEIGEKALELQSKRLAAAREAGAENQRLGTTVLVALSVLAFLALGIVGYVVRTVVKTLTGTVNNLRSGSEQVTSAATQVAASAQTLSQGSTEQAASLEETSASMEEMASMTRKNAENSQEAARLMTEVDRVVDGSNKALDDMTHSMASIRESSNKVSKIIKTIDEIAFQTNILALNAAVEAARAGEAGMGFAVVADEVRNLAQRSAQAAKDTAALIEESIVNSQEGNAKVDLVAQSISAITDSVGKVKGLVTEVSEASRQQSQGIDQVAQAIAQMEKVTQSTAASAEESAAASEELNAQAETTMAEVVRLEDMVVGARTNAVAPRAPVRAVAGRPAGQTAKLFKLPSKASGKPQSTRSAEDEIPMGDTGTYGKF